jgi:hypothetical protein
MKIFVTYSATLAIVSTAKKEKRNPPFLTLLIVFYNEIELRNTRRSQKKNPLPLQTQKSFNRCRHINKTQLDNHRDGLKF